MAPAAPGAPSGPPPGPRHPQPSSPQPSRPTAPAKPTRTAPAVCQPVIVRVVCAAGHRVRWSKRRGAYIHTEDVGCTATGVRSEVVSR